MLGWAAMGSRRPPKPAKLRAEQDPLFQALAEKLVLLRVRKRNRQNVEPIAREAKISAEAIRRVEAGKNVTWETLRAYADCLGSPDGLTLEDFLREVLAQPEIEERARSKPKIADG